jgi:glyoxylase I family protein
MGAASTASGVHRIGLRSTDLHRSRHFYGDVLGFPIVLESPSMFLFLAGATPIAILGPESEPAPGDLTGPSRNRLDHLAVACPDERELQRVAAALAAHGMESTGITVEPTLNRRYVGFNDPDLIAWEFFVAPNLTTAAVMTYFDGLRRKNVDEVPFAADVVVESPLSPAITGAEAVREFLRSVFPTITDVRLQHVLADGEYAAARFEIETIYAVIPAIEWFHVVDGTIVELRPYYDARPLSAAAEPTG